MSTRKVKVSENCGQLMIALDKALGDFTKHTPMTLQDIIGVLAFMAGGAIAKDQSRNERRKLREMAEANIACGTEAVLQQSLTTSLILPEHYHQ